MIDIPFKQLSDSSLYRILKELKPSHRKSLSGLDDTTSDGLNGFDTFENIVVTYMGRRKTVMDKLEQGKRYLKIGYPQHCSDHSPCPSHCISFALSDPKEHSLCKDRHCFEGHTGSC